MNLLDNLQSPISQTLFETISKNDKKVAEFIGLYDFFEIDNNKKHYKNYILKLINSKSPTNIQLSNLLSLSLELHFYNSKIIDHIESLLLSRISYLTKLDALTFLLKHSSKIPKNKYISLNKVIYERTKNDLLKLQASINLMLYDKKYERNVFKVIIKINKYPTPFYRLLNCLENTNLKFKIDAKFMEELISILNNLKYSKEVKNEILLKIKEEMKGAI